MSQFVPRLSQACPKGDWDRETIAFTRLGSFSTAHPAVFKKTVFKDREIQMRVLFESARCGILALFLMKANTVIPGMREMRDVP